MIDPALFDGPYREELPDGTLVYLDHDGEIEYAGPRLRADMPLPPAEEEGRWWRRWPLSSTISIALQSGYTIAQAADSCGVPVDVAQQIADTKPSSVVVLATLR